LLENTTKYPFSTLFDDYIPLADVDWNTIDENTYVHFGGGTDVSPDYYHEPLGVYSDAPDRARDALESAIYSRLVGKCGGFIGICRGAQFLTVMNGGKLIQHVGNKHCQSHDIDTCDESGNFITLEVTSTHHQMMYPWICNPGSFKILGRTRFPLSKLYLNGWNKNVAWSTAPTEPEIVWFETSKSLCIQGHPEYVKVDQPFPAYTRFLISKYLFGEDVKISDFGLKKGSKNVCFV
jgi:hypothetical protein